MLSFLLLSIELQSKMVSASTFVIKGDTKRHYVMLISKDRMDWIVVVLCHHHKNDLLIVVETNKKSCHNSDKWIISWPRVWFWSASDLLKWFVHWQGPILTLGPVHRKKMFMFLYFLYSQSHLDISSPEHIIQREIDDFILFPPPLSPFLVIKNHWHQLTSPLHLLHLWCWCLLISLIAPSS